MDRRKLAGAVALALAACTSARRPPLAESHAVEPVAQPPHDAQAIASAQTVVATPGRPKGYDQPNQYLTVTPIAPAANMEPVVPHDEQRQAAEARLQALQQKYGKRPNILIFLLDDVGWMDFGFNGGGVAVGNPTPTVDRIASQGLILTSAYSQPSCSPTRATIMTGQYPVHHGILIPPMYGQPGGLQGAVTLAKLMSDQGYVTQAIGKWHMGENKGSQPQNVGFDDFRGFLSVSDMYTEWRDPAFNPEIALSPTRTRYFERLPFDKDDVHAVKGGELEKVQEINLETIQTLDQGWAAYGEQFIRNASHGNKPFFLYYATRGCHFDNYPSPQFAGRSPARTVYSDCILEMDDIFGRLIKTLAETGQLENTLVFFTSDNGPEQEVPPYGRTAFRGGKGSTWEGGTRVPTFAYWKDTIAPRKSDGLFDLGDLFNTSLAIAGKPGAALGRLVPQNRYIDGIDQLSFLVAPNGLSNRRSILYFWNDQLSATRIDEFKYVFLAQEPKALTTRGQQGGFTGTVAKTAGATMFDLYTNPQEDDSIGIRHIPVGLPLRDEYLRYENVLKKFPSHVQIGL